jgi:hypothetical protein
MDCCCCGGCCGCCEGCYGVCCCRCGPCTCNPCCNSCPESVICCPITGPCPCVCPCASTCQGLCVCHAPGQCCIVSGAPACCPTPGAGQTDTAPCSQCGWVCPDTGYLYDCLTGNYDICPVTGKYVGCCVLSSCLLPTSCQTHGAGTASGKGQGSGGGGGGGSPKSSGGAAPRATGRATSTGSQTRLPVSGPVRNTILTVKPAPTCTLGGLISTFTKDIAAIGGGMLRTKSGQVITGCGVLSSTNAAAAKAKRKTILKSGTNATPTTSNTILIVGMAAIVVGFLVFGGD